MHLGGGLSHESSVFGLPAFASKNHQVKQFDGREFSPAPIVLLKHERFCDS